MSDEPQVILVLERDFVSSSPTEPSVLYLAEDGATVPEPSPPPSPQRISVADIISGLMSNTQRAYILSHLLTDAEKALLDSATSLVTPNALVIRNNDGTISGASSGGGILRHVYLFPTPSSTWVVTHNLNDYPEVVVLDNNGEEILPDIEYTSGNVITIQHGSAYSGKVILT